MCEPPTAAQVSAPPPTTTTGENTGRWTDEEHTRFLQGLERFGKKWTKVREVVGSRTTAQVRSHAQKYFQKLEKDPAQPSGSGGRGSAGAGFGGRQFGGYDGPDERVPTNPPEIMEKKRLRVDKLLEDMRRSGIIFPENFDVYIEENCDEILQRYRDRFGSLIWMGPGDEELRLFKAPSGGLNFRPREATLASQTPDAEEGTATRTDAVEFVDGRRNRPYLEGAILKCKNKESLEFWTGFLEEHRNVPYELLIERGRDAFPGDRVVIPRFCKLNTRIGNSRRERRDYDSIPLEAIDAAYKRDKKPEIIIRGWDGTGTVSMQALTLEGCCFLPVCSVPAAAANRNLPCEVEAVIHNRGDREALRPGFLRDRVRRDVTDVSEYAFAAGTSERVAKVGNWKHGDTVECWCVLMAAKFFRTPTADERTEFEAIQKRKNEQDRARREKRKKAKNAQK